METKPLKLFVDGHVFDREFQGTQTFLKGLYTQFMVDYPSVDIYFGVQNIERFRNEFPDFPQEKILAYKKRSFSLLRFLFDIPFYLKKHEFNFAHFQYICPKPQKGCKYIVTLHDTLYKDYKQDFSLIYRLSRDLFFGQSIKNAIIKTTVSNYSKLQIQKHYDIPLQKIHVIPNGIELKMQTETMITEANNLVENQFGIKNFILYVSRIEPRKNHLLLLKTYLKLKLYEQNIPLVFIGKESIPVRELSLLMRKLDKDKSKLFYWFPCVETSILHNFYSAAKLFVYASKAEGFGIPVLEAASFEIPVLCARTTAMQDFDFFEPHTFDPNNEIEFEQKLALTLKDLPNKVTLSKIKNQVVKKYNWQHSGNLFYQLLTEAK